MSLIISLLCTTPDIKTLNFFLDIEKESNYLVYIFIDKNTYKIPPEFEHTSSNLKIVKLCNWEVESAGYKSTHSEFNNIATSRDKALYYFCNNNINYDYIWFLEEDVFIPHIKTIETIDLKYPNSDLLVPENIIYETIPIRKWHWKLIKSQVDFKPPYGRSMICAIRVSRMLMTSIKKHVYKYHNLFFCEVLFNTLAIRNHLDINVIPELKYIVWRKNWKQKKININNLYHPIKDIEKQYRFREVLLNNLSLKGTSLIDKNNSSNIDRQSSIQNTLVKEDTIIDYNISDLNSTGYPNKTHEPVIINLSLNDNLDDDDIIQEPILKNQSFSKQIIQSLDCININSHNNNLDNNEINIVLCLFGVIPRSIKKTWSNIRKNIVDPILDEKFNLEIYGFNLNVDSTQVDNMIINQKDKTIVPFDYYDEEMQSEFDSKNDYNELTNNIYPGKNTKRAINSIRQMYSESKIRDFLLSPPKKYDSVIVCGPDFLLNERISISDVINSMNKDHLVYTSNHRDFKGYTNGFYIGNPDALIPILGRYHKINELKQQSETLFHKKKIYINNLKNISKKKKKLKKLGILKINYETILKNSFVMEKKIRKVTNMKFIKLRANGDINQKTSKPTID